MNLYYIDLIIVVLKIKLVFIQRFCQVLVTQFLLFTIMNQNNKKKYII